MHLIVAVPWPSLMHSLVTFISKVLFGKLKLTYINIHSETVNSVGQFCPMLPQDKGSDVLSKSSYVVNGMTPWYDLVIGGDLVMVGI